MSLVRRALEKRSTGFGSDPARIPTNLESGRTFAGPQVNEATALAHIDVYKCVSLIADAISVLPLNAFRNQPVTINGITTMHPLKLPRPGIFSNPMPNYEASEFELKQRIMTSLLLDGNTYNEVVPDVSSSSQLASELNPIHPSHIRKVELDDKRRRIYTLSNGVKEAAWADGGRILHWPGFSRPGSLQGLSPIRAGAQGIALSMAAEEFGSRWFGDGAHPHGYLSTKEKDLDKDDALRVKRDWIKTHGNGNREPAVLWGGLEWKEMQVNPEESQFILTRQMQTSQIASLYRIAPHMVGDITNSTSWGSGLEEQGIGFVVYTLGPWLTRFEQAMSTLLPRGQYSKLNVGALLRGRQVERYQSYAIGRQWGWLSTNDIRGLEDLSPIPEGDTYLQPLNMIDAQQALEVLLKNEPSGSGGNDK